MTIASVTPPAAMSAADTVLLERAQHLLGLVWTPGRHEVATALRTVDGGVYTGARGGIAPGTPLSVESVVSVQIKPADTFRVIAPCGVCRELISDYSPDARVWLTGPDSNDVVSMRAIDLLPEKSRRLW
jgi:cytidine deaminase